MNLRPFVLLSTPTVVPGASRVVGRDGEPASFEQFQWYINLFLNGTFNVLRLGAAAMSKNEPDEVGTVASS